METTVHWGALATTAVLYVAMFALGAIAARRYSGRSASDLMLAGRALPLWLGAATMSATWIGGGYINGTAEAAYSSGLTWVQAPWGYALSLVLGGMFFAGRMRARGFTTMLDPLQARFGDRVAALASLPALAGEIFWSAAILTALGTTFATVVGLDTAPAILLSAAVAVSYTLLGGLWAVALTDALQLALLVGGLWLVVPGIGGSVGGFAAAWERYAAIMPTTLLPPAGALADAAWGDRVWLWWDSALLLVFGGIAWQVYFQRVLAARDARTARWLSFLAAGVCLVVAVPAVLIGVAATTADWQALGLAPPEPALVLPWVLRYLASPWVGAIGLGAIAAAVMSSVDSSVLSAASLAAWNVWRPLVRPGATDREIVRAIRVGVVTVGSLATLLALKVGSVYALWFLCSDFVYCILLPQLVAALWDPRANRFGALAGLATSFVLRFGAGEPVLGLPRLLPYPMVTEAGVVLFPFRTVSALAGLATIALISRFTAKRCPPVPLPAPSSATG